MKLSKLIIIPLFLIILAVFLARYSDYVSNPARYANKLQTSLNQKIEEVDIYFNKLQVETGKSQLELIKKFDDKDIIILKYVDSSLVFWSSNAGPIYDFYPDSLLNPRIVRFFNSFYYVKKKIVQNTAYVGLIEIKCRYPYENSFFQSGFNKDFGLPSAARIRFQQGDGFSVYDTNHQYLFNVVVPPGTEKKMPRQVTATILFFLGIILFLIFLFKSIEFNSGKKNKSMMVLLCFGFIVLARLAQIIWVGKMSIFLLFDPFTYADSLLVPTLGDLLINSLIVLFIAFCINHFIELSDFFKKVKLQLIAAHLLLLLFFINAHYFSYSLIYNSNISFRPNEIEQLSVNTFICLFGSGLNFVAFAVVLIWNVRIYNRFYGISELFKISIPVFVIFFVILFFIGYPIDFISVIFFGVFYIMLLFLVRKNIALFSYSLQELFVLLFSIYSIYFILIHTDRKEKTIRSALAVSLANERDPIAEYLFEDMSRQIRNDTAINRMVDSKSIDNLVFYEYLKKNHFNGYWNKYDLIIAFCGPEDKLLTGNWVYCYGYYDDIIKENGFSLTGSDFYYLDKHNGRISYLGVLTFNQGENTSEITLFIELDSRLNRDLLGYPELLLDEKLNQKRVIDQYSYAKYHKGNLVTQFGSFGYSLDASLFGTQSDESEIISLGGYEHLLYRSGSNNLIVLSRPSVKFIDMVVTFSYLFLFYFLCLVIILIGRSIFNQEFRLLNNFRNKIQVSTIAVLIVSMILIAVSTVLLNLRNYRQNQDKILNEKIQSVLIELSHKLSQENEISGDWHASGYDNLNQLLIRFSDIFFTDINLYSSNGNLLATSRIEIFQLGLQSEKMDPTAFHKMCNEKQAQFIHREKISNLSYISAYVPFTNANGKLLAYLNLPYFTKQNEIQSALTALIVTIINIYVLLILIIIAISILITDQITRPLGLLQLKFRDLKLGTRYERIDYEKDDEIGRLVEEYNRMVGELERNVKIIARSERETAWREMAKQIAHEIKNPLTPMRLSVQQLQRSWQNRDENYSQYLERVTNLLIEQIDNLSSIASGFSNFAQMPAATIERINLIETIQKAVELFQGSESYSISFNSETSKAEIYADKEQMSRVFLNIIKNAIQSIPEDRHGEISLTAVKDHKEILISIADNGQGIPEDIRPRMFTPNFTTKTSGMGLGLAIVNNIVDQVGGKITFETEIDKGTIFYLSFPIAEELLE